MGSTYTAQLGGMDYGGGVGRLDDDLQSPDGAAHGCDGVRHQDDATQALLHEVDHGVIAYPFT